jgi:HEAT repeat protein
LAYCLVPVSTAMMACRLGVAPILTTLLHDGEPEVAKVAAFAVGNLAFHSDLLVSRLRNSVAPLTDLLEGDSDRTQSNAAGTVIHIISHYQ